MTWDYFICQKKTKKNQQTFWGLFLLQQEESPVIHWIVWIKGMIMEQAIENDSSCRVKSALIFCFHMMSLSLIICDSWLLYI